MRRRQAPRREIMPDPLFGSEMIAKLINCVMTRGKKGRAESIVYNALQFVFEKNKGLKRGSGEDIRVNDEGRMTALDLLKEALDNIAPTVEVKSRRVGGSTYQVPIEVPADRKLALSMKWLVKFASARKEKTAAERLGNEIIEAKNNSGGAVKKKEETHRTAAANLAFAHYRW